MVSKLLSVLLVGATYCFILCHYIFSQEVHSTTNIGKGEALKTTIDDKLKLYADSNHAKSSWTYHELADNSDAIIIVKYDSHKNISGDWSEIDFIDERDAIWIQTRMRVLSVLKGGYQDKYFDVLHLHLTNKDTLIDLDFITFQKKLPLPHVAKVVIKDKVVDYSPLHGGKPDIIEPEYLVFLRATEEGYFIPTTGHRFAKSSFRMLNN